MKVSIRKCRKRLATLWFIGAGLIFFVVLFQTFLGRYTGGVDAAWGWLLPTVMPTLSMIIGVLVSESFLTQQGDKVVDKFVYRLSFMLSLSYLIVVALTIFMQPFSSLSPLDLLKQSHLWLGPFQGLVAASLGAFFVSAEKG